MSAENEDNLLYKYISKDKENNENNNKDNTNVQSENNFGRNSVIFFASFFALLVFLSGGFPSFTYIFLKDP